MVSDALVETAQPNPPLNAPVRAQGETLYDRLHSKCYVIVRRHNDELKSSV